MIWVVNVGSRAARITGVGWEAGRFKNKIQMMQMVGLKGFDDVPKMLQESEEACFAIPFRYMGDEKDWIVNFPRLLNDGGKNRIKSLRVVIYTSVGKTFNV